MPAAVAESCGNAGALVTTLPVIDAAERRGAAPQAVATIFANLNATLSVDWLADQLSRVTPSSLWQAMERDLLLDDLMNDHAALAARIGAEESGGGGRVRAQSTDGSRGRTRSCAAGAQPSMVRNAPSHKTSRCCR